MEDVDQGFVVHPVRGVIDLDDVLVFQELFGVVVLDLVMGRLGDALLDQDFEAREGAAENWDSPGIRESETEATAGSIFMSDM